MRSLRLIALACAACLLLAPDAVAQQPPAAATPAAPGPGDQQPMSWVLVELSGRVNTLQREDFRGITSQVQKFAGALGVSGYEVVSTRLPFDITSEGTLTGDISGSSSEAPRFTIVLSRGLP